MVDSGTGHLRTLRVTNLREISIDLKTEGNLNFPCDLPALEIFDFLTTQIFWSESRPRQLT